MTKDTIKFYRKARGVSMERLAGVGTEDKICAAKNISLIESGETKSPNATLVREIARKLGTSTSSLIDNHPLFDDLDGLCREEAGGIIAYIHTACADQFVGWLNEQHPDPGYGDAMSWETVPLDTFNEADYVQSDLYPLEVGGVCVGYAIGAAHQELCQSRLTAFTPQCT